MRSAAHDNAHREGIAAGKWQLTFANGLLALDLRPLRPRNARESHLHRLAHTGCRAVVASIVA
jgi:hypothetical protein